MTDVETAGHVTRSHCMRCGIEYDSPTRPACECAGDPPVDHGSADYETWLDHVRLLRFDREHVTRVETVEKLRRLNDLERIVPIYLQALETIANGDGSGSWGRCAATALREALRR